MEHNFETVAFSALDGMQCNLLHLINHSPTRCPVLLVHGAGVRANIFNPPSSPNIIDMLAKEGYDIWLENWRASIDLPANSWDLDQAAIYDHPVAVQTIASLTGANEIKAIIHCQGSTSFMISAVLGLVPQVKTIISNAVSLHPVVPGYSEIKLNYYMPLVQLIYSYLNPSWGLNAPDLKSKILRWIVAATHWEADTLVGKFVSFTYGAGFPALWLLQNLDEKTMDWIQYEFAEVPISFFKHIKKCIHQGVLVPLHEKGYHLDTYIDKPPQTEARLVFFAGEKNLCFLPESQHKTFNYFDSFQPGRHRLYTIKDYSHLDIFLGKNAHKDIFPIMIQELNKD